MEIAEGPLLVGARIEYFSQSQGGWIPGVVRGYDAINRVYRLDIHAAAPAQKVRATLFPGPQRGSCPTLGAALEGTGRSPPAGALGEVAALYPEGCEVEYYSSSHGGWVPTVVRGFNERTGTYVTDIQPVALPAKLRQPPSAKGVRAASPLRAASPVRLPPPRGGSKPSASPQDGAAPMLRRRSGAAGEMVGPADPVAPAAPPVQALGQMGCGRCRAPRVVSELFGATCGHLFCVPCLQRHIMQADFLRQRVKCICCSTELTAEQVKHLVGPELYAARQAKMTQEDEQLARSLVEGGRNHCAGCRREEHEGFTCEENARRLQAWERENSNADQRFEALMAQLRMRKCPRCGAPSERASGCYFMQCRSSMCLKRTYWCYLCGHEKSLDDHYSHYPRGPYEPECYTPKEQHLPVGERRPPHAPTVAIPHVAPLAAPWPSGGAGGGGAGYACGGLTVASAPCAAPKQENNWWW